MFRKKNISDEDMAKDEEPLTILIVSDKCKALGSALSIVI